MNESIQQVNVIKAHGEAGAESFSMKLVAPLLIIRKRLHSCAVAKGRKAIAAADKISFTNKGKGLWGCTMQDPNDFLWRRIFSSQCIFKVKYLKCNLF